MAEFNSMTIASASEVIAGWKTQNGMKLLERGWGLDNTGGQGKEGRAAIWADIATEWNPKVMTESGRMPLDRALVETAIKASPAAKEEPAWRKLVAGLKFDGFEIVETTREIPRRRPWENSATETSLSLARMLPEDVPEMDFRQAKSEISMLLEKHRFKDAQGHLEQASSAFQRGEWASSNAQLRSFYEGLFNEISSRLGYVGKDNSKEKRDYLGKAPPGFLLKNYNEPDFVQSVMSRFHPEGSHPGLSEEEDATFRLQICLVIARLFLRRYDQREPVS